jgi:phosphoribosylformimino-5-aminoimidazole carboxamide ribotide isomerase
MIAIPAVDLKGGRCVQLVGGRADDERVSLPDPLSVASDWKATGFESLHVVDLDAALDSGNNNDLVRRLAADSEVDLQVGGGIRSDEQADRLLESGVSRIVVGTRALDDPEWLARLASRHPRRVILALDTRDGIILRKGWTEATDLGIERYLSTLDGIELAGVLSTDVGREGRLKGIDRDGCVALLRASPHPVWISGGITTVDELHFLDGIGATGVVLGMALYTDTLDKDYVAARWGGPSKTSDS